MPPSLPNHLPALAASAPYRLAILLPWPSAEDVRIQQALYGSAGARLKADLSTLGVALDDCAICHVSQQPLSTWEAVGWEGDAIQEGIAALAADLTAWRPNLLLGLDDPRYGAGVLHLLRHGNTAPHRTKSGYKWPSVLGKWRGSLFMSASLTEPLSTGSTPVPDGVKPVSPVAESGFVSDARRWKVLTSYHPSYILRAWDKLFDLRQDLRRARDESRTATLNLPALNISFGPIDDSTLTTT